MEKILPILNLLMRFKFFRVRFLLMIGHPIRLSLSLKGMQHELDKKGFTDLARSLKGFTLNVFVDVIPTSFAESREIVWKEKEK